MKTMTLKMLQDYCYELMDAGILDSKNSINIRDWLNECVHSLEIIANNGGHNYGDVGTIYTITNDNSQLDYTRGDTRVGMFNTNFANYFRSSYQDGKNNFTSFNNIFSGFSGNSLYLDEVSFKVDVKSGKEIITNKITSLKNEISELEDKLAIMEEYDLTHLSQSDFEQIMKLETILSDKGSTKKKIKMFLES